MKYKLIIDKSVEEEIIVIVHSPSLLTQKIENLIREYDGASTIIGYAGDEIRKLSFDEIECLSVIDRKVMAIDQNGVRYRVQDRLKDLEDILPSYFIRINKSTLANEHSIVRFNTAFNGGVDAVFRCGFKDYVSRRCFAEIRRRYEGL